MSSREPLWFCHECHAETRPLMTPDPVCASCHSSFVEKLENPSDDPRSFHTDSPPESLSDGLPPDFERFLVTLHALADQQRAGRAAPGNSGPERSQDNRFRFEIRSSGPGGTTGAARIGGPTVTINRPRSSPGDVPTMSEYLRMNDPLRDPTIPGPLMAQYLSALMGLRTPIRDGAGRLGDYAVTQEALDQIMTQLMEGANASQPVPATEEIISDLPREVLESASATLEKECAVCKDQFQLGTDDPEEQVIITLPCNHRFHEGCIIPWLKSSGTCPVCRYALVPQPQQAHGPGSGNSNNGSGPSSRPPPRPPNQNGSGDGSGIIQSLLSFASSLGHSSGDSGSGSRNTSHRTNTSHRANSTRSPNVPGSWGDQLD